MSELEIKGIEKLIEEKTEELADRVSVLEERLSEILGEQETEETEEEPEKAYRPEYEQAVKETERLESGSPVSREHMKELRHPVESPMEREAKRKKQEAEDDELAQYEQQG